MQKSLFILSLLVGWSFLSSGHSFTQPLAVYTDRHGTWRVPTNGIPTQLTNKMIDVFPRINMKFRRVNVSFDLDNDTYYDTCKVWILVFGLCGVLYLVILAVVIIGRYACNLFGGKELPRRGYKQSHVNCLRFFIILFSFAIEFFLIYGYFANTDLHSSISILVDSFVKIGTELQDQIKLVTANMPDSLPISFYNKTLFSEDLTFSARSAARRTETSKSLLKNFEALRMSMILINLILSTVACAVGIASGAVNRGSFVLIMLVLFGISGTIMFFSFGAHFTGSQIVHDYCNEINPYIDGNSTKLHNFIPMRLQYFIPCVSSPLFPFLYDHFAYLSLQKISQFEASKPGVMELYHPQWFNLSQAELQQYVVGLNDKTVLEAYNASVDQTNILKTVDQSMTCEWTKQELRQENFLMCVYSRDNLDMLMMCQGISAILIVILTFLGFPAIKRFEWAGNLGANGILDGKKREFAGKPAKAKRRI